MEAKNDELKYVNEGNRIESFERRKKMKSRKQKSASLTRNPAQGKCLTIDGPALRAGTKYVLRYFAQAEVVDEFTFWTYGQTIVESYALHLYCTNHLPRQS